MATNFGLCAPLWRAINCFALLAALALAPKAAQAASAPLDTGGFETYSVGNLTGQQGWQTIGGTGTAFVQSDIVKSGSKAVRVDRAAGDGSYWAVQFQGGGLPTGRFMLVDWDMRVTGTGIINGTLGPFF